MSFIQSLRPLFKYLPEVEMPLERPSLSERLKWTLIVLIVFLILGQIRVYGLDMSKAGAFAVWEIILASKIGTILTVGIGPIVVASIILQLLIGSGLLQLDFADPEARRDFSSLQKILAIILAFFEAFIYVNLGMLTPLPGMMFWVVLQIAFGSIVLMYLDEVVQKYGVGSGISLFIAGGVASSIFWRIFNPISTTGVGFKLVATGAALSFTDPSGFLWLFFRTMGASFYQAFVTYLFPIIAAIIVFLVVVYFEGVHVNIPLTLGRAGQFGRFPVKFLYVSNIPVILSAALFANIGLLYHLVKDKSIPIVTPFLQYLAHFTTPPSKLIETILIQGVSGIGSQILQGVVYIILLTAACVLFGVLWVQMAGQDAESVARQLQRSGMFLPGFRRDPRVIKTVLERYIPTITILGSAFVGLLAGFASLAGAIGSGMGILLTVDIVYRYYEELAREQLAEGSFLSKVFASIKK